MATEIVHTDPKSIRRRIQWLSLSPLLILVMLYGGVPSVRASLHEGFHLLMTGDLENLQVWASQLGIWAPLATLGLMIGQAVAAPIPAVLVTATNSLLFGPFWGGLYSIFSANLAAAVCYGLARGFGANMVSHLIPKQHYRGLTTYLHHNGLLTVVVARLIPFVPFDPISYVAGLVKMPFWPFFWATMLGQFPAGMAYSYLVHQTAEPSMGILYSITTLLAALALGLLLQRVVRPTEMANDESEEQSEMPRESETQPEILQESDSGLPHPNSDPQ